MINHNIERSDYNHNFIKHNSDWVVVNIADCDLCRKCTKCNLVVATVYYVHLNIIDDFFILNDEEIFNTILNLEELNITCEEVLIKLLLE